MAEFERMILLRSIDTHWTDHIDTMDQLRQGIHLRSYAQQNPLRDYQNEGHELFDMMMQNIEEDTSKFILKSVIQVDEDIEREKTTDFGTAQHVSAEDGKEKAKSNLLLKATKLVVMTHVHVVVARNIKLPWKRRIGFMFNNKWSCEIEFTLLLLHIQSNMN